MAMAVDKNEVALVKLVGGRLREARELCRLTVHEASARLGITKPLLEKIEEGVDVEHLPLKLVRQASLVYDVSVDFLFGFSDDWEVAEETKQARAFAGYIHQEQIKLFSQWAVKQRRQEKQVQALAAAVDALRLEVAETFEALDVFEALNPGFNHLPGGSMIRYRIEKANRAAQNAYLSLLRCRAIT
jgi:transcriptional regulator with XRE-family HTH domain